MGSLGWGDGAERPRDQRGWNWQERGLERRELQRKREKPRDLQRIPLECSVEWVLISACVWGNCQRPGKESSIRVRGNSIRCSQRTGNNSVPTSQSRKPHTLLVIGHRTQKDLSLVLGHNLPWTKYCTHPDEWLLKAKPARIKLLPSNLTISQDKSSRISTEIKEISTWESKIDNICKRKHFSLYYSQHFWREMCEFFHFKQLSNSLWTLTGSPTI